MKQMISFLPVALLPAALLLGATASQDQERIASITDGDTFRLETGERIRIAGIDAPETRVGQAKCAAEITLGKVATERARAMMLGRGVKLKRVGRSYNRTVASVTLDGRDLATSLVANGVARWWPRYSPKPDWCSGAANLQDNSASRRAARR